MGQDTSTGTEPTAPTAFEAFRTLLSAEEDGAPATQDTEAPEADGVTPEESASTEPAETPEDAPAETDENPDEQTDEPISFTVKIDGKDEVVTADELVKGYSRQADYTRKTQKLAEEKKALESQASEVARIRDTYAERLKVVEEALKESAPAEPDWGKLRQENPAEFAARWAEHQHYQQQLAAVAQERQAIEQQQAKEQAAKFQSFVATEQQKLLEALPAWKDPKVAKAESVKLVEFAKSRGFSDQDLAQVVDHRAILMLRDAMELAQIKAKTKAAPPAPQKRAAVLQPGSRPANSKGPVSELTRAKQRLAKTGKVEDLAAIFRQAL